MVVLKGTREELELVASCERIMVNDLFVSVALSGLLITMNLWPSVKASLLFGRRVIVGSVVRVIPRKQFILSFLRIVTHMCINQ